MRDIGTETRFTAPQSPSLVHHFLERSAALHPDKIAVVHEGRRETYARINQAADRLARGLIEAGVGPGDRVAFLGENSLEYIISYYGILKTGGIAVSLHTDMKPAGVAEALGELEPKAVIVSSKFEALARSLDLARFRVLELYVVDPRLSSPSPSGVRVTSFDEVMAGPSGLNPNPDLRPRDCAAIVYTSGSEGKPKGVMLTHANIVANTGAIIESLKLQPGDVQMVVLPFFYVMGKSLLNTHFAVGGCVVINNRFAYTASVLKQMADEGVTGFSGVPSTYAHLLYRSPLAQYRDKLPALRYCSQAGGHLPKKIALELLRVLPAQTRLVLMYGATEAAARLTYVPPESLPGKIESIGIPVPGVTIKILSPDGADLKPGEIGELVASGDNIMAGYYKDEAATRQVLDRRGYHTGDLGYVDRDGFLFLTGRKDQQVKVAGHKINPREIEDVILESGQAVECLVFGVPAPWGGERLAGLAVPAPNGAADPGPLLRYCSAKLPKYMVPESIVFVEAIPQTGSGKPDRGKSLELFIKHDGTEGRRPS